MSLLRDIQNDLAGQSGDVTAILRKCKILSVRLGSREFADWVSWELGGYPDQQPTPQYRHLAITYYASFSNTAWRVSETPIPLQIVPAQHRDSFQELEFRDGIAKAISLTENGGLAHACSTTEEAAPPFAVFRKVGTADPCSAAYRIYLDKS
jgi:hypothetical protein